MKKYKIKKIEPGTFVYTVTMRDGRRLWLSAGIMGGAKVGDVVREFRDKDDFLTVAYSCNDRMDFKFVPTTDFGFRGYAEKYLSCMERFRMNIAMRRALRRRNLSPTMSFENNLRLMVNGSYVR